MRKRADREARESLLASGWIVEGESAAEQRVLPVAADGGEPEGTTPGVEAAVETAPQMSNGALVLLGLLGGLYLLYSWVWFSWAGYYSAVNSAVAAGSGTLGSALQQIVFWAAPFAPGLWFLSALLLNRGARTRRLVLWLLIGAVVLVPLPMFGGVA